MTNEEIANLDNYSESDYQKYIEKLIERPLNDFEKETVFRILNGNKISKSALFLGMTYLFANGKGIPHLEPLAESWISHGINTFEKAKKEISHVTYQEKVTADIKRLVGIRTVTPEWRSYYMQWREWGATDGDIKHAKLRCVKRLHSIVPQYMNGTIKSILLNKRKKR